MQKKRMSICLLFFILLIIFSACSGTDAINDVNGDNGQSENVLEESQLFEVTAESSGEYDFNWTYYLHVPEGIQLDEVTRILVEPASAPDRSDNYSDHERSSKVTAQQQIGKFPKLVAAFPNYENPPEEYGQGWDGVTAGLSRSTMKLTGDLERIDLQLLEMVDHAREKLELELELETYHDIFLWGYSITGTFTANFAKLNPDRVRAFVVGGVDAIILPHDSLAGYTLNYNNGVNDFDDLIGSRFDREAYNDIAKYFYIGELESFYKISLDDTLGKALWDTMDDSYINGFKRVEEIYQDENIPAQFVTYQSTAHQVRKEMLEDTIRFFEKNMGPSNEEITPHEYTDDDYMYEFDRIEEVKVLDAYWGQDPELPDELAWIYDYDGGEDDNMVLATDIAFDSEIQIMEFIKRADFNFTMKADGQEDIELSPWDVEPMFYRIVEMVDEEYNGILLRLIPDNMEKVDQSVEYTLEMDDSVSEFYGIEDGIKVEAIE